MLKDELCNDLWQVLREGGITLKLWNQVDEIRANLQKEKFDEGTYESLKQKMDAYKVANMLTTMTPNEGIAKEEHTKDLIDYFNKWMTTDGE